MQEERLLGDLELATTQLADLESQLEAARASAGPQDGKRVFPSLRSCVVK